MFHVKHDTDGVVVIGGGHAGLEAAHVVARMGAPVILITHATDRIGEMSCNPAVGGVGKGHLVRELDAFDGIMPKLADRSGIQFRLLNMRRGPAVRGPRAQCDREQYKTEAQRATLGEDKITVIAGSVTDIEITGNRVHAVMLSDGQTISCGSVVVTAGTFLRGTIHVGGSRTSGGRVGEKPAVRLAERLQEIFPKLGRLKTGTPPRLLSSTIDYGNLDRQDGDEDPSFFSEETASTTLRQISCQVTHTNAETHEIIAENIEKSAMYSGSISGKGPRYCPSIEDKIMRFADKDSHQIFLEPEGLESDWVYPNGISTSLPVEVQEEYVRSIKGLEQAEIVQPGYAIEYDFIDPSQLQRSLGAKEVPNLFLAGQINGTTGYEEAAAQGLVAGINAVLCLQNEDPFVLSRTDAYIGVLIDDLVTQGVTEPYRMFTSRAEHRLHLRADNAEERLFPYAATLGTLSESRLSSSQRRLEQLTSARHRLSEKSLTPRQASEAGITVPQNGVVRDGLTLLSLPDVDVKALASVWKDLEKIDQLTADRLKNDAHYAHYVARSAAEQQRFSDDARVPLPADLDYASISGLSKELVEKLLKRQPQSIADARRIEGMTPAALALIFAHSQRHSAPTAAQGR